MVNCDGEDDRSVNLQQLVSVVSVLLLHAQQERCLRLKGILSDPITFDESVLKRIQIQRLFPNPI